MNSGEVDPATIRKNPKKVFRECGTCSHTFGHILNREFGHPKVKEEHALAPLAGGVMNTGHQCGMLWGATLAVGAESFRRHEDPEQAVAAAVIATQHVIESFSNRTNTINCREIIGVNLDNVFGLVKYMTKIMIQGMDNSLCFNLAEQWAPEAIQSAMDGLAEAPIELTQQPVSCASKVVKKMGATDEEATMVAGFAGGLGLRGNACGALSAAIWMKTLTWCKENPDKTPPYFKNKAAKKTLKSFFKETDSEILCKKISGQSFKTIDEHSEFINNGGCDKLIEALAKS